MDNFWGRGEEKIGGREKGPRGDEDSFWHWLFAVFICERGEKLGGKEKGREGVGVLLSSGCKQFLWEG